MLIICTGANPTTATFTHNNAYHRLFKSIRMLFSVLETLSSTCRGVNDCTSCVVTYDSRIGSMILKIFLF
jgi:hypothetical protein